MSDLDPRSHVRACASTSTNLHSDTVRRIYEGLPYPGADETALTKAPWRIAPPDWINALWRPESQRFQPRRILIAGCGTGSEAFAIRRHVPAAEIVAVDFSPRSIRIARRLQRGAPAMRDIQFLVADLAANGLADRVGRSFDFISCHGVLSYLPEPERALANFVSCLTQDGALYLGVNGADHPSGRWRPVLPEFGLDASKWRDNRSTREVLRLLDAMADRSPVIPLAPLGAAYLAGDLFGPPIRNLSLADWLALTRKAGLHFRGSHSCGHAARGVCEKGLARLLMPRSRATCHEIEETLMPSSFHRLLLTRRDAPDPPWTDGEALRAWRPLRLPLHSITLPPRRRSWNASRHYVRSDCRALNLRLAMRMPRSEIEFLRQSDGTRSIDEILRSIPVRIQHTRLRDQLYMLYLLLAVDLLPPA